MKTSKSAFHSKRKGLKFGEMAATFVSDSSGASRVHRPILLSAEEVSAASCDPGYEDRNCSIVPPLRTFPIEASHPIIESWPVIRAHIMTVLDQSNIKWSSLGVLRRRQTLDQKHDDTTVVLALQKGNEDEVVKRVEEDIYEICKSTGNAGLFVEVLVAEITRFHETYEVEARGGSSLGATGVDHVSGTLGGYIKLTGKNGSRVFALSCHHVVVPNKLASEFCDNSYEAPYVYRKAVGPGQGHHIRVSQPSAMTHIEYVRDKHRSCQLLKQDVIQLRDQVKSNPRVVGKLDVAEDLLRTGLNDLQRSRDFNLHFGTVATTSGYRKSTKIACSLDWALVDAQHTRQGRNEVPRLLFKPLEYSYLSEGNTVTEIAPLSIDEDVMKTGSKTSTTYGRISHIKHDCNIGGNGSTTSEYVVVGREGTLFAAKGDSGAFVLDRRGRLAGLLIAGEEALGTVYVTPIEEVMRDIEEVTGCSVTLP
ncbi:hypothetical protein GP486_004993 [Trichoglossum hirsutum]|uniref:Uncharacterized protein n=1 Tax=Trichoglossum hirsutum TaxID=265104 RepID=A0A9P8LA34_9PEZI|nr:hypothetical protein GP486_004993 [Trichoglossum hirsutum]